VDREVVADDDGARLQRRRELGSDVGLERLTVHGAVHNPRAIKPSSVNPATKGLCSPRAERGGSGQSFAPGRAAAQAGEIGFHGGLVNEHELLWNLAHRWKAVFHPFVMGAADAGLASFIRDLVKPCPTRIRPPPPLCQSRPCRWGRR